MAAVSHSLSHYPPNPAGMEEGNCPVAENRHILRKEIQLLGKSDDISPSGTAGKKLASAATIPIDEGRFLE